MLKPMREFVRELCQVQGCSDKDLDSVVMAINEACMNIIQHAYHEKADEEIIIEFWQDGEQMLIKIFDFADSVDLASIKSRDLDDVRPGGLGVHLISQVMDSVEYKTNTKTKGNILEMRKHLKNPAEFVVNSDKAL